MKPQHFILSDLPELILFINFDVRSSPGSNSSKRRFPVQSLKHDGLHDFEQKLSDALVGTGRDHQGIAGLAAYREAERS